MARLISIHAKDYSMAAFFATVDTAIMGRKTLEAV